MQYYQIKEMSQMTSLSIRTLQYYDDIGLVKPSCRSESNYRCYNETDLLQIQQVITLKYLGFSLRSIKNIIQDEQFDMLKSLQFQSISLADEAKKIEEAAKLLNYIAQQTSAYQSINWKSMAKIISLLERKQVNTNLKNKYSTNIGPSELGKSSQYDYSYNPERLYAIPRSVGREDIGIHQNVLPFYGFDCWNHYEVSWLNAKGKPIVATAQISYDCHSPNLIESKSLKLYFNSLNNHKFESVEQLRNTVRQDLEVQTKAPVRVDIILIPTQQDITIQTQLPGINIDDLDVNCDTYQVTPEYLSTSDEIVEETVNSNLLKSNCLVTEQPDWGSLLIEYCGRKINHEGLLKYIVSFRNHNEFHEQCIERIFTDIMRVCKPGTLTVYGRYTRRGGLDINPYRSTKTNINNIHDIRLLRQ